MARHADLPPGSRRWAEDVDRDRARLAELEVLVRRMATELRIDPSNPGRDVSSDDIPRAGKTLQQKLSGLADTQTFNVADGQVLTWDQAAQAWKPADLPEDSGGVEFVPATEEEYLYTDITSDSDPENNKVIRRTQPGNWGNTGDSFSVFGQADASVWMMGAARWFGGPTRAHGYVSAEPFYVKLGVVWTNTEDPEQAWDELGSIHIDKSITFFTPQGRESWGETSVGWVNFDTAWMLLPRFASSARPVPEGSGSGLKGAVIYDTTLNKPLFWNGSSWRDAMGNAV